MLMGDAVDLHALPGRLLHGDLDLADLRGSRRAAESAWRWGALVGAGGRAAGGLGAGQGPLPAAPSPWGTSAQSAGPEQWRTAQWCSAWPCAWPPCTPAVGACGAHVTAGPESAPSRPQIARSRAPGLPSRPGRALLARHAHRVLLGVCGSHALQTDGGERGCETLAEQTRARPAAGCLQQCAGHRTVLSPSVKALSMSLSSMVCTCHSTKWCTLPSRHVRPRRTLLLPC
jgi:hypothetical protein